MARPTPNPGHASRLLLLARATFGFNEQTLQDLVAAGRQAWIDEQLDPLASHGAELQQRLTLYPWLDRTASRLRSDYPGGGWRLSHESRAVRLLRAVYSRRQLYERTVELWSDHFNVPFSAQDANYLRPVFDREVIRGHAFASFPSLLHAVAKSPAMLAYLDGDENAVGAPNENYARELLELHTLGVDGGYTELDVREIARCFTGWSYVRHWEQGEFGTFRFDAQRHDSGTKLVLGRTIPAGGGVEDGELVLRLLATHPGTARFVGRKIASWYLGYEPPHSVVTELATTYERTGGDVRSMLTVVLRADLMELATPKVKRPFCFATSFLRAVDADIQDAGTGTYALEGMGQPQFAWPTPDGYPDDPDVWASNLLSRWRFAASLTTGWNSWVDLRLPDLQALVSGTPRAEWAERISEVLTGGALASEDAAAIQAFVDQSPSGAAADLAEAFELAASSPSYQLH